MVRRVVAVVGLLALAAMAASCGGKARGTDTVKIEGPSFEPQRVPIRTLAPAPTDAPTPIPTPTSSASALPTETPIPPPSGSTITSAAGTQKGDVGSYCWSDQVGAPSQCYHNDDPVQASALKVKQHEKVKLHIDVQIPPDDESIRPFQGSRSGYPDQSIQPAQSTELTVDLAPGTWSMDLCATWHGRGQPICWLFKLSVVS